MGLLYTPCGKKGPSVGFPLLTQMKAPSQKRRLYAQAEDESKNRKERVVSSIGDIGKGSGVVRVDQAVQGPSSEIREEGTILQTPEVLIQRLSKRPRKGGNYSGNKGEEQEYHRDAFEYYWQMKPRSYRQLSKDLSIPINTVERWAKVFKWGDRVSAREQENRKMTAVANWDEVAHLRKQIFWAYKAEIGDLVEYDSVKQKYKIRGTMDPKKAQYLRQMVEGLDALIKDRDEKKQETHAQQINVIIKK